MRWFAFASMLLLASFVVHQPVAAQKAAAEETYDWRLYETAGRTWTISTTVIETNKKVTDTYKVLERTKEGANLEYTKKALNEKDSDVTWTKTLLFNAHPGNLEFIQAPEGKKQAEGELVEVAAGKYFCDVYKKGAGKKAEYWYMSQHMPGLIVKSETKELKTELMTFTKMNGDPDLAEEKLTPEQKKQRDWALFLKKGRKWTFKQTKLLMGETVTSYYGYEITGVAEGFCNYLFTQMDAKKKAIGKAQTFKVEFTEENAKLWGIRPWDTWTQVREEEIEAAGRKWMCVVYEDKKFVKDATMTYWYSKDYPGMAVKITCKGEYNDSEDILHEWKD
jgi:hypothetical protein